MWHVAQLVYIVRQMIDHKNISIAKEFDAHVFVGIIVLDTGTTYISISFPNGWNERAVNVI